MSQIIYTIARPAKTPFLGLWLPTLFVLITGSLLAILIFLILAYQLIYLNRIYPGVQMANVNAGGMTQAEVMAAVSQRAPEYLARRVTIVYGPDTWTFTGQELGMEVDAAQTARAAYAVGRKGNLIADLLTHVSLLRTPRQIEPVILYDSGLTQPLVFRFAAETGPMEWRLEPAELVGMIDVAEIVNDAGKPEFSITPNREKFRAYLEQTAATLPRDPLDARLEFKPETNQLVVLQESQEGRSLDIEATLEQVMALKNNPSHRVDLPVGVILPLVSSKNLDSLGIKALVSEATTYFKGSNEARMQNIALSASRFNGVIIPPGEIFSFNEHLGPVTKEAGFNESLVIQGNRTSVGLGGGVCQVSTTAFRAAFFGGYEIVERWAHGYRVGWYETNSAPGLDATVYTPDVDLKFRNDTAYYLLIQTSTDLDAGTVTFRFYSTPTGREVTVTEPETSNLVKHGSPLYEEDPALPTGVTKQVDWAVDGLDVLVKRTVKEGDTVIHQDEVFSHYQPWQAVYKVGTGG